MSWQSAREADKNNDNGRWFKLKNDGDKDDVIFLGEPFEVMENAKWGPSLRFQFNVFVVSKSAIKVASLSQQTFKKLLSLHDEGQVTDRLITVKRRGLSTDTEYDLIPKGFAPSDVMAKARALPVFPLPYTGDAEDDKPASHAQAPAAPAQTQAPAYQPPPQTVPAPAPAHVPPPAAAQGDPAVLAHFNTTDREHLKAILGWAWTTTQDPAVQAAYRAEFDRRMAALSAPPPPPPVVDQPFFPPAPPAPPAYQPPPPPWGGAPGTPGATPF